MEEYKTIEIQNTPEAIDANSGSDYLLSSSIEIGFVLISVILLYVLHKCKDRWLFKKLKINYNFTKMFIQDLLNAIKVAVKKEAIETKHKNNIEVKVLDKVDEELFKKYESILQQKLERSVPKESEQESIDKLEQDVDNTTKVEK